ncbi:MAG: hypothetical protein ABI203_08225, partial [Mucilaginibacter sp.]
MILGTFNSIIVDVASSCQTIIVSGATTLTLLAPLSVDSALTIDANLTFLGTSSASICGHTTFGFNIAL